MFVWLRPAHVSELDASIGTDLGQYKADSSSGPIGVRVHHLKFDLFVRHVASHTRSPVISGAKAEFECAAESWFSGTVFRPPGIQSCRSCNTLENFVRAGLDRKVE